MAERSEAKSAKRTFASKFKILELITDIEKVAQACKKSFASEYLEINLGRDIVDWLHYNRHDLLCEISGNRKHQFGQSGKLTLKAV
jgi:hypothetical protein